MTPIGATKLAQYLQNFTSLEIKRFKKFLESPFHNTNQDCIKLFSLIRKYHPDYDTIPFTKEKLYEKIYGKKKYQSQQMNDLFKSLRILVEDFMIVSDILKNKKNRKEKLIETFHNRNLPYFKDHSNDLIEEIHMHEVKNEKDYLKLYLENKRLYFDVRNEQKIKELDTFINAHQSLDLFYILAKCKFLTEEYNRKKIYKESDALISWHQLEKLIPPGSIIFKQNPIIKLFYKIINLQKKEQSKSFFFDLKKELISYIGKVDSKILRDLFMNLTNYCIQKNNLGDRQYNKDCLELYKILVDNDLLLENNLIREIEYINISLLAYRHNSIAWGDEFCVIYKDHLYSDNVDGIQNIVFSYKYFYLKDYKLMDKYLNRMVPEAKGFYYPKIKALVIRSLYEDWMIKKKYTPALLSNIQSYERALYRNKDIIAGDKLKAYLNFIQILKKIIKLVTSTIKNKKVKIDLIQYEINKRKLVAYKKWLEEQLKNLE